METIIKKIADFIKSYIPETIIEKIIIAVMSFKSGKLSTLVNRSKKSADNREKARDAERKAKADEKYREIVRGYFNRGNKQ